MRNNRRSLLILGLALLIAPAYCVLERYDGPQEEAGSGSGSAYPDMPEPVSYDMPVNEIEDGNETSTQMPEVETTSTTTTTTTSTPSTTRRPLAFEDDTSGIIQNSNNTMDKLQMELLKYETQLNLNTLDTLLPVLEEIRTNMTQLLRSSSPDHRTFQEQSQALDTELTEIEAQIRKNRELQQHYETIQESTKEQLGMVYNSLGNLLNSQVYILGFRQKAKSKAPKSHSEIHLFIDHSLTFTAKKEGQPFATQEIYTFLKDLATPDNRRTGYSYFLEKINASNLSSEITLDFVRDVFTFPELSDLKEDIPSAYALLFSDEPKGIKSLYDEKLLTVGAGSAVQLVTKGGDGWKRWKFYAQENSEYFAIVDTKTNQALGLVSTRRLYYSEEVKSLGLLRYDETTQLNPRYLWMITSTRTGALTFKNKELPSYAIVSDGSIATVSSSYYVSQNWVLV